MNDNVMMKSLFLGLLILLLVAAHAKALHHGISPRSVDGTPLEDLVKSGARLEGLLLDLPIGQVVVDLERNDDLVPERFKTSRVGRDGRLEDFHVAAPSEARCHWLGKVRGIVGSSVGVSFCDGEMHGCVLFADGEHFEIGYKAGEPKMTTRRMLSDSEETAPYDEVVIRKYKEIVDDNLVDSPQGVKPEVNLGEELFIEMILVSDPERMGQHGNNAQATFRNNLVVMNNVAAFLAKGDFNGMALKLTIVQNVFFENESDDLPVSGSTSPNVLLSTGNVWRRENLDQLEEHDVVHYISGKDFDGTVIGLAILESICDDTSACERGAEEGDCFVDGNRAILGCCSRNSFAISQVSRQFPLFSAATIVHEVGHQLGFSHDSTRDATACAASGFIMAAVASSNPNAKPDWSRCTEQRFTSIAKSPILDFGYHPYACLSNKPSGDALQAEFTSRADSTYQMTISISVSILLLLLLSR